MTKTDILHYRESLSETGERSGGSLAAVERDRVRPLSITRKKIAEP